MKLPSTLSCLLPCALLVTACGGDDASEADRGQPASDAGGGLPPVVLDLAQVPNVVLISIDTLRPDHLGAYGYARDTSPRIDAVASEGAVFETCASSTSWTLPAHAAMFTGLSDHVHGCTDTDKSLAPSRTTLAERLKAAGYTTGGFWSGPYLHPVFGLYQGFETWVDCTSYAAANDSDASARGTIEGEDVWKRANEDVTGPRVLANAKQWLEQHGSERFFLFLHFWDCHFDFIPPAPYDTRFDPDYTGSVTGENFFFDPAVNPQMDPRDLEHLIALYDGEIAWTDHNVGLLLDALEERGIADETLVVITSDHGTAFFEHGQKAHRNTLFDELIRVPLVLRLPGRIPAGTRVAEQVRLIDILPTVLDLVGLPQPTDVMGRSLAPAFGPQGLTASIEPAVSELNTLGQEVRSYRRVERKLIQYWSGLFQMRNLAFDLVQDPGERVALSDPTSNLAEAALEDLDLGTRWIEFWKAKLPVESASTEIPAEVWKQLQGFGYVGGGDE